MKVRTAYKAIAQDRASKRYPIRSIAIVLPGTGKILHQTSKTGVRNGQA